MTRVAYGSTAPTYNSDPPFHPGQRYPELAFTEAGRYPNLPYELLRTLLHKLGLDEENFGTPRWNPLGGYIQPGQTVLLKPNFVTSFNGSGSDLFAVVTHPSILRALVDYAYRALQGQGRIIIADAPEMSCQWDDLMAAQRLDTIQQWYQERLQFQVDYYDLRNFAMRDPHQVPYAGNRVARPGDPQGHTVVNLGRNSAFFGLPSENYYGADFDRTETIRHHHGETHEYSISNSFLRADVILSVPKMKVHKKVGVTLNLKGLVGANTNKNYLIHYRVGSPSQSGDQLPDGISSGDQWKVQVQRWLYDHALARQSRAGDLIYSTFRGLYRGLIKPWQPISKQTRILDGGNWHGNDSAWRMTSDLAKILFFADANGVLQSSRQRRMFCVVDGIIAGEREGPLAPAAKASGCLVMGENPFAVDLVTTRLMGFDPRKIRQFDVMSDTRWEFGLRTFADIEVRTPSRVMPGVEFFEVGDRTPYFDFTPHPGWVGQIEI